MNKILSFFFIVVISILFFNQFFLRGLLPIPSDTIIGLYHPFRDLYAKNYPNGIPFKNFLITDPVRQQYPWKALAISIEKKLEIPLWNPYSFSGTPLLANFQSGSFYPLNILFFVMPFNISWSLIIFLETLLAIFFFYLYLDNFKINKYASVLGAISFGFSGFSIVWLEWGTVIHTALWLPLILLSIDKLLIIKKTTKKFSIWSIVFIFSLISSFFAGHLQTFFYVFIVSLIYILVRFVQYGKNTKLLFLFIDYYLLFVVITSVQWIPTLQFILYSARDMDQANWQVAGWFIPWQNLIQFIAPDFFGNPTTLNYWGVWNYAEFIGYIGIFPLLVALFALFFRHDKKTLFFGTIFFLSLIFSLPTIFAKIPYLLKIPLLNTSQPTRLLFLTDFSLAALSAFGFDYFLNKKNRGILYILLFVFVLFAGLWIFVLFGRNAFGIALQDMLVAKRNLLPPSILFSIFCVLIIAAIFIKNKKTNLTIYLLLIFLTIVELFRFGFKFIPFTTKQYLFPQTSSIEFLQKQKGQFRIMSVDSRILPPNFSVIYGLQTVEGYDPLYLKRYGELIAASERGKPNILAPFGFNRIITPHNYNSKIIDLLSVKYILSLSDILSPNLKKVFQEGELRIFENKNAIPRVFFVKHLEIANNNSEAIDKLFQANLSLKDTAVVEGKDLEASKLVLNKDWSGGEARIIEYSENRILITTDNDKEGFLVLTDSFYPTWHATIDGKKAEIFRTDYNFRGIVMPKGKHTVIFYDSLL